MPSLKSFIDFLEKLVLPSLAESWDNVGLLLGDPATQVNKVMTCLTVTPASVAEAVEEGAELIVTHHPVLFKPTQKLTTNTPEGRLLIPLLRAGVAVYSPHTAFDNAAGGINDILARRFGMEGVEPLRHGQGAPQFKIVAFVPNSDLQRVCDAMFAAGAGNIGHYSHCSFRVAGTGTFFGSDETNPTVGQKGRREEAHEWRLEVICPGNVVDHAVRALRHAHSYEEPAVDVHPLRLELGKHGAGRVGTLRNGISLRAFAQHVNSALHATATQLVGNPDRSIKRVAVACGAAGEFLKDAIAVHADVFVTGEMRFHDYLAAEAAGISLVLPGHYATERCGIEELAATLQEEFAGTQVWASKREKDPAFVVHD